MSNKSRWTRDEELELIKDISNQITLDKLTLKHNRTESALELRLKKIIYENALSGKSLESIAKLLNLPEDKTRQYFYSYKDFKEKHTGLIDEFVLPINNINKQSAGSNNLKIESKLKKLKMENKILKIIVENKELTHKLNKLIKDGHVDNNIKSLINLIQIPPV